MYPLVETYLYHVGRQLPQKQKQDIIDELRANIYDQLESHETQVDDKAIENVLLELGSPDRIAKEYTQDVKCVIGPELVETYWTVLKFALIGVTIAYIVIGIVFAATMDFTVSNITQSIIKFLAQTWQTGLSVYAMITLIFTAVYRGLKSETVDSKDIQDHSEEVWSLKKLKALKTPPLESNKLKKTDSITDLIGIIVGFLILNAIAYGSDGNLWLSWFNNRSMETTSFQAFNSVLLRSWMPVINILLLSNLVLHIYLLIQDKWSNTTRLIHILLELVGLGVFLVIWMNPTFIDLTKVSSTLAAQTAQGLEISMKITRLIVTTIISVITGFTVFGHANKLVRTREK